MPASISEVQSALKATYEGLDAAGYSLEVAVENDDLAMTVLAREGACPDCLVPKPLFLQMVRDELKEGGLAFPAITVSYPKDQKPSH